MANRVQHLRGSLTEHSTFTGEKGEISLVTDTSANRIPTGELRIHDGSTAGGLEVPGVARAWVNFNGTLAMTVGSSYGPDAPPADYSSPNPIRAAYNVASITDNGTGDYTINFATAMPDVNYSINSNSATGSVPVGSTAGRPYAPYHGVPSTTSLQIYVTGGSGSSNTDPYLVDRNYISVAIFR